MKSNVYIIGISGFGREVESFDSMISDFSSVMVNIEINGNVNIDEKLYIWK